MSSSSYRQVLGIAACFVVAVTIVSGAGILSNVGAHAVDQVLAGDAPGQAQTAKIAVVGMFNKVIVDQAQTALTMAPAQPTAKSGGLFGLTSTDYAGLAVFMTLLAVFVVTVCGAWLFFKPANWW